MQELVFLLFFYNFSLLKSMGALYLLPKMSTTCNIHLSWIFSSNQNYFSILFILSSLTKKYFYLSEIDDCYSMCRILCIVNKIVIPLRPPIAFHTEATSSMLTCIMYKILCLFSSIHISTRLGLHWRKLKSLAYNNSPITLLWKF